jgi:hypothetical protein
MSDDHKTAQNPLPAMAPLISAQGLKANRWQASSYGSTLQMRPCRSRLAGDGALDLGARLEGQSLASQLLQRVRQRFPGVERALSKFCAKGLKGCAAQRLAQCEAGGCC